jgi:hypothetical protein
MWARIDEEHNWKEKNVYFSNIIQWLTDLLSDEVTLFLGIKQFYWQFERGTG